MTQGYQGFLEKKAFLDLLVLVRKAYLVKRASKVSLAVQGLLVFQVSWSLCAAKSNFAPFAPGSSPGELSKNVMLF